MEIISLPENVHIHTQERDMSEMEKADFLDYFQNNPTESHVAFVIIGGAFGEGVDLVSDRLTGVVIVGIGLSKLNFESDKIAAHYDGEGIRGYNFAYLYPGMNKVAQAVGRLIRSETDTGVALLIEERYLHHDYRALYKKEWDGYEVVLNQEELKETLQKILNK